MTPPDDLDALVNELNAGAPRPRPVARDSRAAAGDDVQTARLRGWLVEVIERSGSDLLLVAGAPPSIRVNGIVTPLDDAPLGSEEIEDAIAPALPPHARKQYRDLGMIAYLTATGRPIDEADRQRLINQLWSTEQAGRLPAFRLLTPPPAPPLR